MRLFVCQWNDAQQCVTYEIWARRKAREGKLCLYIIKDYYYYYNYYFTYVSKCN